MTKEKKSLPLPAIIRSSKLLAALTEDDGNLAVLPDSEITTHAKPSAQLWQLRANLWKLLDQRQKQFDAIGHCEAITTIELCRDICDPTTLAKYLDDPFKCAFLSRPLRSPSG